MRSRIATKIVSGFVLVMVLLVVLGGYALMGFNQIGEINEKILGILVPGVEESKDLQSATLEMVVALRGYIITGGEEFIEDFNKFEAESEKRIDRIYDYAPSDEERKYVADLRNLLVEYVDIAGEIIGLKRADQDVEAIEMMSRIAYPKVQEIKSVAHEYVQFKEVQLQENRMELKVIQNNVTRLVFTLAGIALFLGMIIAIVVTRGITKPVNQFIGVADKVAKGDLTGEVEVKTRDEISILAKAFNTMLSNLKDIVGRINQASQDVAAASEQLSAISKESSEASEQIATITSEVSSAASDEATAISKSSNMVNDMKVGIEGVTRNIQHVNESANITLRSAEGGLKSSKEAVETINKIKSSTLEASTTISHLSKSSQEIEKIVEVINAISDQTNLLALNAAIEAARAGEAGKGFTVVAEEVRKLAEESSDSTQRVAQLIADIQGHIVSAVSSMSDNTKEVDLGVEIINKSSHEFASIYDEINEVSSELNTVSGIVSDIVENIGGVTENFEHMSAISQETAASAQEVAASSQEQTASIEEVEALATNLAGMAEDLIRAIDIFRL